MKLEMTALTDLGKVREINEDNVRIYPDLNLALVCDGMGGHAAGEVASALAVETMVTICSMDPQQLPLSPRLPYLEQFLPPAQTLVNAIRLANRRISKLSSSKSEVRGMGTTAVAAQFGSGHVVISHVGDSRAYRFRNGNLEQLTVDHSWLNELIASKQLTEEESLNFGNRNVITRALGTRDRVKVDLRQDPVQTGDIYLLCTDGLSGFATDQEILRALARDSATLDEIAAELIARANAAGGEDNISVALVRVLDPGQKGPSQEIAAWTVEEETNEELRQEDRLIETLFSGVEVLKAHEAKTRRIPRPAAARKGGMGWLLLALLVVVGALGYIVYNSGVLTQSRGSQASVQPGTAMAVESLAIVPPDTQPVDTAGMALDSAASGKTTLDLAGFPDSLLDLVVYVDEIPLGTLRQFQNGGLEVEPGLRRLVLRDQQDSARGQLEKTFAAGPGQLTPAEFGL